ncbi:hypothetical protein [Pantanalinema sp. GBBB05]|uniref:hypothetical protein n=1 Tax=Pantanalinema sp. GBBB05 TaxID=2604139 RepID=UPI001D3BCEB2|nr:hypothetical protein [Pantanalinema sp. GBBB05]
MSRDELSDRNRERLNQATGDRLSRQTAKSDRDSQLPLPSQSAGYKDGRYWQQRPGHKPLPVTAVDTNGGVEDGQPVTMRGNRMDAMPRVRTEKPTTPQPRKRLLIKYLYSLGQTFYVGGWQPDAVAVYTLQTGESLFAASLDNLGGDLWRVDLVTTIGTTTHFRSFANTEDAAAIDLTTTDTIRIGELYGFGFSYLSLDGVLIPVPPGGSVLNTTRRYTLNGTFQLVSGSEVSTQDIQVFYYGVEPWYTLIRNTLNANITGIPLTPELTYNFSASSTGNNYVTAGGAGLPPIPEDSSSGTEDLLTTIRIDQSGRFAIGRYATQQGFTQTSGLLWIAGSTINRLQTAFDPEDYYLDVQTTGFTAIPKTEFDPYLADGKTQISIQFAGYSSGFNKQGDLETLVYPPKPYDLPTFNFYAASYHE